jgi:hypothetical protein
VLEKPDGSSDLIAAADLAKLLDLARSRLKLVTLSSCLSAAMTIEQTLSALNIEPSQATRLPSDSATQLAVAAIPMSVARVLVQRSRTVRLPYINAVQAALRLPVRSAGSSRSSERSLPVRLAVSLGVVVHEACKMAQRVPERHMRGVRRRTIDANNLRQIFRCCVVHAKNAIVAQSQNGKRRE